MSSPIVTTRTTSIAGCGSGPTLGELREFIAKTDDWDADSRVSLAHTSGDPREGSSWRIELRKETRK